MPGRQVLRFIMPGRQVLRTTDLSESSHLVGRARAVAPSGAVVASTDGRTGKDDADLSPEDGSEVR